MSLADLLSETKDDMLISCTFSKYLLFDKKKLLEMLLFTLFTFIPNVQWVICIAYTHNVWVQHYWNNLHLCTETKFPFNNVNVQYLNNSVHALRFNINKNKFDTIWLEFGNRIDFFLQIQIWYSRLYKGYRGCSLLVKSPAGLELTPPKKNRS